MSSILYTHPDHQAFHVGSGSSRALLIHGFLGSPRDMRPLAEALATAGVSTHGVLLPGFGPEISRLSRVRADEWLDATRTAWQELRQGAERTTLIGFSMGGAVALSLAAEGGLAPDHLVLLAPHWKFAARRAALIPIGKYFVRQVRPFGRLDPNDPQVRRAVAELAPEIDLDDPEVQRAVRDSAYIPTHALDELRRINNRAAAVSQMEAPISIVQGLQDTITLPLYSRRLASRLGARLYEVTGDHVLVDPRCPSWSSVRDFVVNVATGSQPGLD
jgi:carboxylesterase